jgi:hypothetical protein
MAYLLDIPLLEKGGEVDIVPEVFPPCCSFH